MIDEAESIDEPDQPAKDQWWSSFIIVEKINKIVNDDPNTNGPQDLSPRSYRSTRSYARSSIVKDRPLQQKIADKSFNIK